MVDNCWLGAATSHEWESAGAVFFIKKVPGTKR
jgi:hypothetical protein